MTKKLEFIQNDVSTKVVVQYIKITLSIYFSAQFQNRGLRILSLYR